MSYVALYREWRPQSFQEVVGQSHITRTLLNALKQERVSHAYLFCGPRGTGKTSVAKILAKAVNCLDSQAGEPCNQCLNCQSITAGSSLDVLEIDAASNRGIDEIRELRERVQFVPSGGRFRVYIIDEVHMLTTEAFNALLKTLEEPPGHVVFVLATTEAHKVPTTILSRCQRFDFHRIALADLAERLRLVAEKQNISISEEALMAIVRTAEGGMRDALSLLDQCAGFADSVVSLEDVNQVLGTVSETLLAQTVDALAQNEPATLLRLVEEAVNQGKDVRKFVRDLIGYLRDLLLIRLGDRTSRLVIVSETNQERLTLQANQWPTERLIQLIHHFTRVESEMKWAIQPRWMLEASLVEAGSDYDSDSIETLKHRVELLEKHLEQLIGPGKQVGDQAVRTNPVVEKNRAASSLKTISEGVPGTAPEKPKQSKLLTQPVQQREIAEQLPPEPSDIKPLAEKQSTGELNLTLIQAQWKQFMEALRKRSISLHALVLEAEPTDWLEGTLGLSFRKGCNFHRQKVEETANKTTVEEVLSQVFQQPLRIRCSMQDSDEPNQKTDSQNLSEPDDPWQDPLVQGAAEIFGADRIKIK
ncbi:MAG: DNA polymerase III subunit gamma/tau [Bacillota bacterium]